MGIAVVTAPRSSKSLAKYFSTHGAWSCTFCG
jgi:hypothetical protein